MNNPDEKILVARLLAFARELRRYAGDDENEPQLDEPPVSLLASTAELLEVAANNIDRRRSFIDETVRGFQASNRS